VESNGLCILMVWRIEMERTPKRLYSPEFRADAIKLIEKTGLSVDRAVKQLLIPKNSLDNWVRATKKGRLV
jgi:transposase